MHTVRRQHTKSANTRDTSGSSLESPLVYSTRRGYAITSDPAAVDSCPAVGFAGTGQLDASRAGHAVALGSLTQLRVVSVLERTTGLASADSWLGRRSKGGRR